MSRDYQARPLHNGVKPGFRAVVDNPDGWLIAHCMTLGDAEQIAAALNVSPSQGLDAASVEREWSLPDLRDLHTDVQRIRDHDLGNKRMRDLLQATMDTLVAADVEYAALATEPHQHGGKA